MFDKLFLLKITVLCLDNYMYCDLSIVKNIP